MRLGISLTLASLNLIFLIIHMFYNIWSFWDSIMYAIQSRNIAMVYIFGLFNIIIGLIMIIYIILRLTILKNKIYKLPVFAFYAIPIIYLLFLCIEDMIKYNVIDINAIFGLISVLLLLAADLLFNKVQIKLPPTKADRIAELEKQVEELKAKSDDK